MTTTQHGPVKCECGCQANQHEEDEGACECGCCDEFAAAPAPCGVCGEFHDPDVSAGLAEEAA